MMAIGPIVYIVVWGGAILVAWAALRKQQVDFGWRNGSRHYCGYVDRNGSYNRLLGHTCAHCGKFPSAWENVTWKSKFFGGIEVSSGKDGP